MKEEIDFIEMEELYDALERIGNMTHKEPYDEDDLTLDEIEYAIGEAEDTSIVEEIVDRYNLNDIVEYLEDDIKDTNELHEKLQALLSFAEDKEGYHNLMSKVDCLDVMVRSI